MFKVPKINTKTSRDSSPGFTLIELMVTVGIATLILAIATPLTIQYLRQRGVRDAADQLAIDLQRAKLLAIQRHANCSITINTPVANQYTISLTNEVMDLGRYPGGVTFSNVPDASAAVITFTPQGVCQVAGSIYLTDQSIRLRVRTSIAGAISVHLFAAGQWT